MQGATGLFSLAREATFLVNGRQSRFDGLDGAGSDEVEPSRAGLGENILTPDAALAQLMAGNKRLPPVGDCS
jgi:hypothetical protein